MSASSRGIYLDIFLRQIHIQCVARFAGIFLFRRSKLASSLGVVSCYDHTSLGVFDRNRSNILLQLDDTANSCKTYTNLCSNLSTRLSCTLVQSYDLRTFPGRHVHLARQLTYKYFTVDPREVFSNLMQ